MVPPTKQQSMLPLSPMVPPTKQSMLLDAPDGTIHQEFIASICSQWYSPPSSQWFYLIPIISPISSQCPYLSPMVPATKQSMLLFDLDDIAHLAVNASICPRWYLPPCSQCFYLSQMVPPTKQSMFLFVLDGTAHQAVNASICP